MSAEELYPPCGFQAVSPEECPFPPSDAATSARARLRAIIDQHYAFLWRTLRYLGVPDSATDDAAQQVLCIIARRLAEIATGAERSFVFSTALRVASEARRASRRRPAVPVEDIDGFPTPGATPEEALERRRAHEALRDVLEGIPVDLRMVFVLFELEELTQSEIASMLGIAQGTVASRLRRARDKFRALVRRRLAAGRAPGAMEGR